MSRMRQEVMHMASRGGLQYWHLRGFPRIDLHISNCEKYLMERVILLREVIRVINQGH